MPLPAPGVDWPPRPLAELMPSFYQWDALYSSDLDRLYDAFGGAAIRQQLDRPLFGRGISKLAARFGWGRPAPEGTIDDRLHVPLAADLCAATAELGWADPPVITTTNDLARVRVGEYVDDRAFAVFAAGTEIGAALGGHYVRAVIPDDGPRAVFEVIAYDGALPRFEWGKLRAVTFWWELGRDGGVWRHLESHELDTAGNGVIVHGLFLGTDTKLGTRQPLAARPELAGLTDNGTGLAGGQDEVTVSTGTPGLDCVHIPARTPQRLWRKHPIGRHLGRSILQGIEGPLSKLDDAYTSWMRDIELGKSRLVISRTLLDNPVPGQPNVFDTDSRLLMPVDMPPSFNGPATDPIRMVQFQIRVDQHRATCQELTEIVLRAASYSAQTFGEDESGNAMTATGVMSKDSRSMRTRRAFLADETAGVQHIIRKALAMEQAAGLGDVADDLLTVVFPDGAADPPAVIAQTVAALRAAEAASDETIVRKVNPDWDDLQVIAEVALIQAQRAATSAVPSLGTPDDTTDPTAGMSVEDIGKAATAYGVLTRAGVPAATAARQVGLPGLDPGDITELAADAG